MWRGCCCHATEIDEQVIEFSSENELEYSDFEDNQ